MQERISQKSQIRVFIKAQCSLLDHKPTGRVTGVHLQHVLVGNDTDEEQHQSRSHQVQSRAADGLVGPEIHGRKAQQQRKDRAHHGGHQHSQQLEALQGNPVTRSLGGVKHMSLLHQPHKQNAHECTKDHDTFQRQVDDTASLGKHAGQRHDHQRNSKDQCLLDQKCHASSPPFSCSPSGSGGVSSGASSGCACASGGTGAVVTVAFFISLRFLIFTSIIRITREKADR